MTKNTIELLPFVGMDKGLFLMRDNSYMDIFRLVAKDLISASESEIELDMLQFEKFYKGNGLFKAASGILHIQLSDRLFFNGTVICQSAETQFSVDIYSAAKNAESDCISLFACRVFKK